MSKISAPMLGAIAGVMVATTYVVWDRTRPPPCTGAVFIELRPPLEEPGPYRFRLVLDGGDKPCELTIPLPLRQAVDTKACGMKVALETRSVAGKSSIVGLTIGAAPERLRFEVRKHAELIYDTELLPHYAPYETRREDDKRFCGERALLQPACKRGSSECAPFAARCDGPEDCPDRQVCCLSPEWGREFGAAAASECSGRRSCIERLAQIACHSDADCPEDMACNDTSLGSHFKASVRSCKPREGVR